MAASRIYWKTIFPLSPLFSKPEITRIEIIFVFQKQVSDSRFPHSSGWAFF